MGATADGRAAIRAELRDRVETLDADMFELSA